MKTELPDRKRTRLQHHDYNKPGYYFLTLCTKGRRCILSDIVEKQTDMVTHLSTEELWKIGADVALKRYGRIVDKYINQIDDYYKNISVVKYVIMPNHVHLIVQILRTEETEAVIRIPARGSIISRFISTLKRFCNKEIGNNIWQYRSFDHVVRNKYDLDNIYGYIVSNPARWLYDRFHPDNDETS